MNLDEILSVSTSCMNVLQNGACDRGFEQELKRYANLLLSRSSSELSAAAVDENFESLIMYMAKLVAVAFDKVSVPVFRQLFRTIIVFSLHLYSSDQSHFARFVNEWPKMFACNYVESVLSNCLPLFELSKRYKAESVMSCYAISSLILFVYFSDDSESNPFLNAVACLDDNLFPKLFESIQKSMTITSSVILFYTLVVSCNRFKAFCLSCVDTDWVGLLTENLHRGDPEVSELKIDILLMLTEDPEFANALASMSGLIIPDILRFICHFAPDTDKYNAIISAISVLCNIGQYMNDIETKSCEMLFTVIQSLLRSKNKYSAEYVNLLVTYIEAVVVYRAKTNISLVYALVRNVHILKDLNSLNTTDSFQVTLHNLTTICDRLLTGLMGRGPLSDHKTVVAHLHRALDTCDLLSLVVVREYPAFTYVPHDFGRSAAFFRRLIIADMQEIL